MMSFSAPDPDTVAADQPLGLIVPSTARVIRSKTGELIWDELAAKEFGFRMSGGATIIFEEEDEDSP